MQWRRRKTSGAGDEEEGECDPEETKWRIGERRKAHRWKWNIGGEETDRGDTFCGANQKKDIDPSSPKNNILSCWRHSSLFWGFSFLLLINYIFI